jgi:hypothetical protein
MKKILFFVFGIALAVTAMSQTLQNTKQDDKKDLRQDIRTKDAHKKAAMKDLAHLKVKKAGKQQDKVNAKRKDIHQDTKVLRAKGEKRPTHDAKKVIRRQDAAVKG